MRALGFKYEARKKYYFVDGHEKEGTKRYRKKYVKELLRLEKRMYRWIQIKRDNIKKYEKDYDLLPNCGFYYPDKVTGEKMAKFYVDLCDKFQDKMKESEYGGNLSVRFSEGKKPIIMIGHDECIFKQYHFTNKSWVGDNESRPILPKDEGAGIMISAFQCRKFGFGLVLTKDQLKK